MSIHSILLFGLIAAIPACTAPAEIDEPFGWAVCTSLTSGDDYDLTGGRDGKEIVLKSDGADMRDKLREAILNYDIVVLDGADGEFVLSTTLYLDGVKNKSILGINGATLKTQFELSPELKQLLLDAKLTRYSWHAGTGGKLSNGVNVSEEREMMTRQLIIDHTGDQEENYRKSGLLSFTDSENIIIRDIAFVGPGSVDLGADDCISLKRNCTHFWIDHCSFCDGMDGNMDITGCSDLNTVSWCKFFYTGRSYDHSFSNLIAGTHIAHESKWDYFNTTFYACEWGQGVESRTPMARFGTVHMLNCYINCPDNIDGVNPRDVSEFLIENCWFSEGLSKPVVKITHQLHPTKAWTLRGNIFKTPCDTESSGDVTVPYEYGKFVMEASEVPGTVGKGAGPRKSDPRK